MGTHPIKYFLLNKTELSYEILIRGVDPASTVLELKKQINKMSPVIPSTDILESGLEPTEDLEGAANSLKELTSRVKQLEEKYEPSLYERSRALCNHLFHRLKRIELTEHSLANKTINKDFTAVYNRLYNIRRPSTSAPSATNALQLSDVACAQPPAPVINCDHQLDRIRPKFDGVSCVRAFLKDVKDYASIRNATADRILAQAPLFFIGNAKHWYRSIRDSVKSWNELTTLLLNDFSKSDYDYRLLAEIRNRTQGPTENVVIYFSIMSDYFTRLIKSLSEQEKLDILLHNIRPCYSNVLAANSDNIDSVEKLRKLCRNYENVQGLTSQYKEPPRVTTDTLAPDLAFRLEPNQFSSNFKKPNTYKTLNNNYSNDNFTKNNPKLLPVNSVELIPKPKYIFCPRCRSTNHSLKQCKVERFPICFKCGKRGVVYASCKDCQSNSKSTTYKCRYTSKN